MKTKCFLNVVIVVLVFVLGLSAGNLLGAARRRSLVIRMEAEATILKDEIERYKTVIRDIRSTANQAMPIEMSSAAADKGK
jgi:hypothetical protein